MSWALVLFQELHRGDFVHMSWPHHGAFATFWQKTDKCPTNAQGGGEIWAGLELTEPFVTDARWMSKLKVQWTYELSHTLLMFFFLLKPYHFMQRREGLLSCWTFLGSSFSLMRLFRGLKIWPHLHLPVTNKLKEPNSIGTRISFLDCKTVSDLFSRDTVRRAKIQILFGPRSARLFRKNTDCFAVYLFLGWELCNKLKTRAFIPKQVHAKVLRFRRKSAIHEHNKDHCSYNCYTVIWWCSFGLTYLGVSILEPLFRWAVLVAIFLFSVSFQSPIGSPVSVVSIGTQRMQKK